ncbi:MAG: hypothetical protein JWM87_407 [Candidatus Eremiobacteraeota bacterium]|nr:hypothetical protein [Candidatus Eremiobacteraeota bacterium]
MPHAAHVYTGEEDGREKAGSESSRAAGSAAEGGTANSAAAAVAGHDRAGAAPRPASLVAPLDPKFYTVADEPLAEGLPVDYRYLYELIHDRFVRGEERGKSVDAKLAALLTGVVAAIGFSFRINLSVISAAITLFYFVPLALIALAYTTKLREVAPTVNSIDRSFPVYPVSTVIEAIAAMRAAIAVNAAKYEQKSVYLDYAVIATLAVTLVALLAQLLIALKFVPLAP